MDQVTPPQQPLGSSAPRPQLSVEVVDALTGLETAIRTLTKVTAPDGGGLGVEPPAIVEFIRRFEALRNQLGQVDQHIVTVCDTHQVAHQPTQRSTATLLATTLLLSAGEAARRVRAAAALSPRVTALGVPLDPARPVLAAAVGTGTLSAENIDIVIRCLDTLGRIPLITPEDLDRAEHDLTVHAGVLRPEDLRTAATRTIECYDPDGQAERDRKNEALRELRLVPHRDGSYSIAGRLTGPVGAQLYAVLSPLARPRPANPHADTDPADHAEPGGPTDHADPADPHPETHLDPGTDLDARGAPNGQDGNVRPTGSTRPTRPARPGEQTGRAEQAGQPGEAGQGSESPAAQRLRRYRTTGIHDDRTTGQRWHDAFADLVTRAGRAGGLPESGGTPATVIVTIGWEDLLTRTGHGITTDGTPLSAATVLKLADQALILPTVLTSSGAVLSLGRASRIATRPQTMALIARDGGCTFPGCDHPPEWCQRHHLHPWIDGGTTDLDNLTLVCGYHHRTFDHHGWTCTMINNLPHWTPPRWIDPTQTPILHHRLTMRHRLTMSHRPATGN